MITQLAERFAYWPPRWCSPPPSPSIEAATAQQKHDNDDNEKSCHIHAVSPSAKRLQIDSPLTLSEPTRKRTRLRFNCSVRNPLVHLSSAKKAGAAADPLFSAGA